MAEGRRSRIEPSSQRFVLAAAVGVGVVSFLATEFMHYMLAPDLRSQGETSGAGILGSHRELPDRKVNPD